MYNIFNI